jgi:hypothetical protein
MSTLFAFGESALAMYQYLVGEISTALA